jgi:RNA polymerase sigma-B factor
LWIVDDSTEDVLQRMSLAPLLARLPERERHILSLRFYRGWTQEQIAQYVGVTQMQVSRVLKRILADLRQELLAQQATSLRAS